MGIFQEIFAEDTEDKIERWRQHLVENVPEALGQGCSAGLTTDSDSNTYVAIKFGSALILVDFVACDEDDEIRVHMPQDGLLPFYRYLLEWNIDARLTCRVGMENDVAMLFSTLDMDGITDKTFLSCLGEILDYADELAEFLVNEFGAGRWRVGA